MKIAVSLALALSAATLAPPASAQFAKAEDAIKYRQSALTVLGTHFGRLGAMANGRAPYDAAIAAADADVGAIAARLPWHAFGPVLPAIRAVPGPPPAPVPVAAPTPAPTRQYYDPSRN